MSKPIIEVRGISKRYKLGTIGAQTMREELEALFARFKKPKAFDDANAEKLKTEKLKTANSAAGSSDFWALRDVSFDVQPGEVLGIIGRNGAGKSTLLKILSRITEPTSGEVRIRGRIASLLEVGTGFHPELSGRENIFLNGAILGMTKAEIRAKFDEIVDFAGVEQFIDTPVKRYSSGMYVRLAFAVAAHLEPEILIVDEVLAVGDAAFQKKCLIKMQELNRRDGRTVLFVSHQMAMVAALCSRMVLLNNGKLDYLGSTFDGIQRYLNTGEATLSKRRNMLTGSLSAGLWIVDAWMERNGERKNQFVIDDRNVTVSVLVEALEKVTCGVELVLRDEKGYPVAFAPSGLGFGIEYEFEKGCQRVSCVLPPLMLASGSYSIDLILAESGVRLIDSIEGGIHFSIEPTFFGPAHWNFPQQIDRGCTLWDVKFLPPKLLNESADSNSLA